MTGRRSTSCSSTTSRETSTRSRRSSTTRRYRLLRADDADKALRLLLDHDVAAIVLDIKMPGVSGFELAQDDQERPSAFARSPIVFLTAYLLDDQDVIAGYGAGAVDYLTKPVNPQILRSQDRRASPSCSARRARWPS